MVKGNQNGYHTKAHVAEGSGTACEGAVDGDDELLLLMLPTNAVELNALVVFDSNDEGVCALNIKSSGVGLGSIAVQVRIYKFIFLFIFENENKSSFFSLEINEHTNKNLQSFYFSLSNEITLCFFISECILINKMVLLYNPRIFVE